MGLETEEEVLLLGPIDRKLVTEVDELLKKDAVDILREQILNVGFVWVLGLDENGLVGFGFVDRFSELGVELLLPGESRLHRRLSCLSVACVLTVLLK